MPIDFHSLSIEEIGTLRREADEYLAIWFGFAQGARAKRTPEWVEAASKRLDGRVEPCCECLAEYPSADLHFRDEIYCEKCRQIWSNNQSTTVPTPHNV